MGYQPKRDRQPPTPAHRKRGNTVRTSNAYLDTSPFERGVDPVVARNYYRDDRRHGKDVADHLPSRSVKEHLKRFDSHRPTQHAVQQQRRQYPSEQEFVRRHKRHSRYDSSSDSSDKSSNSEHYFDSSSDDYSDLDSASDNDRQANYRHYASKNRRPTYNFRDDDSDSQSDLSDQSSRSDSDSDSDSYSSFSDPMEDVIDLQVQPNKAVYQRAGRQKQQQSGGQPAKRPRTEPARDNAPQIKGAKQQKRKQLPSASQSTMSEQLQSKVREAVTMACDTSKELDKDALIQLIQEARSAATTALAPAPASSAKKPRVAKPAAAQPTRTSPRKQSQQAKTKTAKKQTKALSKAATAKTPKVEQKEDDEPPKVEATEIESANKEIASAVNTPSQPAETSTTPSATTDAAIAPSEHHMSLRNSPTDSTVDSNQPAQA